jgi:hypothetical protein
MATDVSGVTDREYWLWREWMQSKHSISFRVEFGMSSVMILVKLAYPRLSNSIPAEVEKRGVVHHYPSRCASYAAL